jgi:signal transduction protein with GAF and PtsI domain
MVMATKMDKKRTPEHIPFGSGYEIELRGTTICPGIGIGRVRVLDRERVVLRSKIPADQAQAEKQRYNQAVQLVSDHLLEHIQEDHSDSSLSASMILKSHQAILTDEQFHDAVRARIVADPEIFTPHGLLRLDVLDPLRLPPKATPFHLTRRSFSRDSEFRP